MYKAKKNRQVMEAQVANEAKVNNIFIISFHFLLSKQNFHKILKVFDEKA